MHEDGENSSLFASCALMKHSSYSELLLSLFLVGFFLILHIVRLV